MEEEEEESTRPSMVARIRRSSRLAKTTYNGGGETTTTTKGKPRTGSSEEGARGPGGGGVQGSFTPPPAVVRTYARRRQGVARDDAPSGATTTTMTATTNEAKGGKASFSSLYDPTVPLSPGFKRARPTASSKSDHPHSPPKRRRRGVARDRCSATSEDEAETIPESPSTTTTLTQDIWLPSLKRLRVVSEDAVAGGRVVMLNEGDGSTLPKRIQQLVDLVNDELGWNTQQSHSEVRDGEAPPPEQKIFVFVSKTKQAIGCLMVERVDQAFRVVGEKGTECSTQPEPAIMGISRIWVHRDHRRKGVASQLLDAARAHFAYGYTVPKAQCAFTQPTRDGHALAARYLANPHFLVYK